MRKMEQLSFAERCAEFWAQHPVALLIRRTNVLSSSRPMYLRRADAKRVVASPDGQGLAHVVLVQLQSAMGLLTNPVACQQERCSERSSAKPQSGVAGEELQDMLTEAHAAANLVSSVAASVGLAWSLLVVPRKSWT